MSRESVSGRSFLAGFSPELRPRYSKIGSAGAIKQQVQIRPKKYDDYRSLVPKITQIFRLFLIILLLILALLMFRGRLKYHRICAELPNGLLLGYEALFDPQEYFWRPNVVLKLPDGTVLLRDRVEAFYFSKTTVYGVAERERYNSELDYAFSYRPDVGLVLYENDPERYEQLRRESGPIIWVYRNQGRPVHTGLWSTYTKTIELPAYRRERCHVNLFP